MEKTKIIDVILAKHMGKTVEELNQFVDKKIKVKQLNKDGKQLFLYRKITSKHEAGTLFFNRAMYYIVDENGEELGYIDAKILRDDPEDHLNDNFFEDVEFEYFLRDSKQIRGKRNMGIAVDAALEDVLVNGALDKLPVRDGKLSKINNVYLFITGNDPSRKVAIGNGFIEKEADYGYKEFVMSKELYMKTRGMLEDR